MNDKDRDFCFLVAVVSMLAFVAAGSLLISLNRSLIGFICWGMAGLSFSAGHKLNPYKDRDGSSDP